MDDRNIEKLLEQGLSGSSPGEVFRAKVLLDSTAVLARPWRIAPMWRIVAFSAAAALIAGISFFLGRCSVRPDWPMSAQEPVVAKAAETVAVPNELIAWLDTARFFRQLGMEDRVARAYERASELLPHDTTFACDDPERMLAAAEDDTDPTQGHERPTPHRAANAGRRIIAQSWGD